jgi:hypothetical protein
LGVADLVLRSILERERWTSKTEHMDVTLPLDQMTTAEKLRVMETIWADLSRNEAEVESPAWHADVLRERDARYRAGEEKPVDWETAKQQLRDRLL